MKTKITDVDTIEHNPDAIGPKHIDIEKILAQKKVKVPRFAVRWLERILHAKEINDGIFHNRHLHGLPFAQKFIEGKEPFNLGITLVTLGIDQVPRQRLPVLYPGP